MKKIIVLHQFIESRLAEDRRAEIQHIAGDAYRILPFSDMKDEEAGAVQIAFGPFSKAQTDLMPNLMWQQLPSAGVEGFLKNAEGRPSFILTNATGAFGVSISEHVLALMLSINRGLHHYRDHQAAHLWKDAPPRKLLADSTALIIGLGDIGLETAKRAKAMGMRVLAIKRAVSEKPGCVDELCFDLDSSLERMLREADYVALCLPNTPHTQNVLDQRRLSLMKDGAVVINIGRGALIDQEALTKELAAGRLSAGLDVTTPEPLPPEDPLWALPECVITPHMSGRSDRSMKFIIDLFADNLARFLDGRTLLNLVDFTEGY